MVNSFIIRSAELFHLGGSFSGEVEPGAAQEHVELLPGFASRLLQVQITLNLWTAAGVQEVLPHTHTHTHIQNIDHKNCCKATDCILNSDILYRTSSVSA